MIIFSIGVFSLLASITLLHIKISRKEDKVHEKEMQRVDPRIGKKIRFNQGFNYGKTGTIVGYGFCRTLDVLVDGGQNETFVSLKEVDPLN